MKFSWHQLPALTAIIIALGQVLVILVAISSALNSISFVFLIRAFPTLSLLSIGILGFFLAAIFFHFGIKGKKLSGSYLKSTSLLSCLSLFSIGLGIAFMSPSQIVAWQDVPPRVGEQIRVLSWNTDDNVSDDYLLKQALALDPDIIAFPEAWQRFSSDVDCTKGTSLKESDRSPRLCEIAMKLDMRIYFIPNASQSTLLIKRSFGEYEVSNNPEPKMAYAGFIAKPVNKNSRAPHIFLAHIQRPDFTIGTTWWNKQIAWARENCANPRTIMVGDFNATLANMQSSHLGSCQDVATLLGKKSTATWPTFLPASLGAAIDHIYVGSSYLPLYYSVLVGSDLSGHRPIFSILKVR